MRVLRPRLLPIAVCGLLLVLGGSGCAATGQTKDKEFHGEQSRVANTVRDLDDAYADEHQDETGARTVCRTLLSKRLVTELSRNGTCEKNARLALKNSDPVKLDVREVKIAGDTATVRARVKIDDDHQRTDTLTLVREGNTWKFDGTTAGQPAPAEKTG